MLTHELLAVLVQKRPNIFMVVWTIFIPYLDWENSKIVNHVSFFPLVYINRIIMQLFEFCRSLFLSPPAPPPSLFTMNLSEYSPQQISKKKMLNQ